MNPIGEGPGERLAHGFGIACAVLLVAMTVLTVVDVIGRDLLDRPVPGAYELTEVMLALLIFAGLPLISRAEEHVTVGLFADRLSARAKRLQSAGVNVVGAVVLAVVAWQLWIKAGQMGAYGDVTVYLRLPMAPVGYAMAVLTASGALYMLANARLRLSGRDRAGEARSAVD